MTNSEFIFADKKCQCFFHEAQNVYARCLASMIFNGIYWLWTMKILNFSESRWTKFYSIGNLISAKMSHTSVQIVLIQDIIFGWIWNRSICGIDFIWHFRSVSFEESYFSMSNCIAKTKRKSHIKSAVFDAPNLIVMKWFRRTMPPS